MPIVQVYKCPITGQLFELQDKSEYFSHLRRAAIQEKFKSLESVAPATLIPRLENMICDLTSFRFDEDLCNSSLAFLDFFDQLIMEYSNELAYCFLRRHFSEETCYAFHHSKPLDRKRIKFVFALLHNAYEKNALTLHVEEIDTEKKLIRIRDNSTISLYGMSHRYRVEFLNQNFWRKACHKNNPYISYIKPPRSRFSYLTSLQDIIRRLPGKISKDFQHYVSIGSRNSFKATQYGNVSPLHIEGKTDEINAMLGNGKLLSYRVPVTLQDFPGLEDSIRHMRFVHKLYTGEDFHIRNDVWHEQSWYTIVPEMSIFSNQTDK